MLAVGGLDPTGGAGILLDVAAARAVQVHGSAVLAVSTIQDGEHFMASRCEEAGSVRAAMEVIHKSVDVGAVKTGALGNAEIVETVADLARSPSFPPLIVDPVIHSTTQGALLDDEGTKILRDRLISAATLITPNLAEASILIETEVSDIDGMRLAGMGLVELGAQAALIKGGHLVGDEIADVFVDRQGNTRIFTCEQRALFEVRGTGCALASLIAGLIAKGYALLDAVESARQILQKAIQGARHFGKGPRMLGF